MARQQARPLATPLPLPTALLRCSSHSAPSKRLQAPPNWLRPSVTPPGPPCSLDLVYECELEEMLKQRTETEEGKELRKVGRQRRAGQGGAGQGRGRGGQGADCTAGKSRDPHPGPRVV